MRYTAKTVEELFKTMLQAARQRLASLEVANGREPNLQGLNGWVFEQTVRFCLEEEFQSLGNVPPLREQVALSGRAKIDLLVGAVAIELKVAGFFGNEAERYRKYRSQVQAKGWTASIETPDQGAC